MAGMNGGSDRDDDRHARSAPISTSKRKSGSRTGHRRRRLTTPRFARSGNVTRIREEARAIWQGPWTEQVAQDARYAARMLARAPGFSAVAVLTSRSESAQPAPSSASSTRFFYGRCRSAIPTAWCASSKISRRPDGAAGGPGRIAPLVASDVAALRSQSDLSFHVGVQIPTIRTITSFDEPVRLVGVRLSPDLLVMTGTKPLMGRLFASHEDAPGAGAVVILSYATWHRYFGAEANIIGRTVGLDGKPHTVVGIMGPEFSFPIQRTNSGCRSR
jgi:putative ABC transport system permease protein